MIKYAFIISPERGEDTYLYKTFRVDTTIELIQYRSYPLFFHKVYIQHHLGS